MAAVQEEKISKNEAVRRALAELGASAGLADIQGWVKDHYGLEMSLNHISTSKGESLRKAAKRKEAGENEPAAASGSETGKGAPSSGPTKREAVRLAMAELGPDASRLQLQEFVQSRFGYAMSLDHISNCKAELASKGAKKKGGKKRAAPKPAARQQEAAPAAPAVPEQPIAKPTNGKTIPLEDILTLRELMQKVGSAQLRVLLDVMGK